MLPLVAKENVFALKGGTAINLEPGTLNFHSLIFGCLILGAHSSISKNGYPLLSLIFGSSMFNNGLNLYEHAHNGKC